MSNLSPSLSPVGQQLPAPSGRGAPVEEVIASEKPLLIRLDGGFIARIEAERDLITHGTGHKLPRTHMIRILLLEALNARARARNEAVPTAVNVGKLEEVEGEAGDSEEDA